MPTGRCMSFAEIVPISAKSGDGVDRLVNLARACMPEGPVHFPEDVMTDQPMRVLAAELIREKILQKTRDELPFAVAVGVDFLSKKGRLAPVSAAAYVVEESHTGIRIGEHRGRLQTV